MPSLPTIPGVKNNFLTLTACNANPPLNFPPCWVNLSTKVPAGDKSPEAQLYAQFPIVANYLAEKITKLSQDTKDGDGEDHVNGNSLTTNALSNAIMVYCLNEPYSTVQSIGWKTALANILQIPLVTWNSSQGMISLSGNPPIPVFIQQRAPNKWSLHPVYFAFFFFNGAISFLRYVRYDSTYGFVFTDTFANIVIKIVSAFFVAPKAGQSIDAYVQSFYSRLTDPQQSSLYGTAYAAAMPWLFPNAAMYLDGFETEDTDDKWLWIPERYPEQFCSKLQSAGNNIYSAQAHAELMEIVSVLSTALAVTSAGLSIAASGLTVANGLSLISAFENSPFGYPSNTFRNLLVGAKILDLPSLLTNMGLTVNDPSLTPVAVTGAPEVGSLSTIAPTDVIDVSSGATAGGSAPVSVDSFSDTDLTDTQDLADIGNIVNAPDVDITDSDGSDLTASSDIADVPINITPEDPTTVTPEDLAIDGSDTSTADNAMASALANSGSGSNFNLSSFIAGAAKVYATLTAASASGKTQPHTANYPTPGSRYALPNGDSAVVNRDGSTTVYDANGNAIQTILPSGKIISGGPLSASSLLSNPWLLGGIAAAAAAMFLL